VIHAKTSAERAVSVISGIPCFALLRARQNAALLCHSPSF
jgi:hypothetical protein